VIVDSALYTDGVREPGTLALDDVPNACRRDNAFVWLGLYEPTVEEFDAVQREFQLHELAVEDAVNAHQRPKLEIFDNSIFMVLKTARYRDEVETVDFGEILIFVGDGFIVVVRHGLASELTEVRHRLEARPDLLRQGPSAVLHAIIDHVVDDYAPVVDGIEDDIGEVERSVFSDDASNPVERIYKLKREVLEMFLASSPLVPPLEKAVSGECPLIHDDIRPYFRDVLDHLLRVVSAVQNDRDLLTSVLEANLTRVSVRQNEDMRKISAWVAIAAVPTAVAAIYGMNFEHMPELESPIGYPAVLLFMVVVCLYMYRRFRRSGWL
jgi:magnesium transporter